MNDDDITLEGNYLLYLIIALLFGIFVGLTIMFFYTNGSCAELLQQNIQLIQYKMEEQTWESGINITIN